MTEQTVAIPAHTALVVTVDRNRATQLVVPEQDARLIRDRGGARVELDNGTTTDGRTLKLLHVVDEHTREAHEILVQRTIDADQVVAVGARPAHTLPPPALP